MMKSISQKEFFRKLIKGASAKVGAPNFPGNKEMSDDLVEDLVNRAEQLVYRKVTHTQSNAIKFENDSWFFFSKPKNCDSRKAYQHEIEGNTFVSLVDHRPAYNNPFGVPIPEKTMVLVYQLAI